MPLPVSVTRIATWTVLPVQPVGYDNSATRATGSLNVGPAVAVPVPVTATVGVGGAATTGSEPVGPDVCPVEAEIQQLLLVPV